VIIPAEFDPSHPDLIWSDPYPVYEQMRSKCPVGWSDRRAGFWYLTRFADVRAALQDPDTFSSVHTRIPYIEDPLGGEIPLNTDPPLHALYRRVLAAPFSQVAVRRHEPKLRSFARRLLEDIARQERTEFITSFAVPYPSSMFCFLMDVPESELGTFLQWKDDIFVDRRPSESAPAQRPEQALAAFTAAKLRIRDYYLELYQQRRGGDGDDLVTYLSTAVADGGRPLSTDEVIGILSLLFIAGLDTVTSTIGLMMAYLAGHPEKRRELVERPGLIPSAVEELLRFESIVATGRLITRDCEVAGTPMKAGDRIMLMMGAADRDPAKFPDPDEVDFTRSPNPHLAFGGGPHRCLGSHLARLELTIALEEILRAMPDFHITPGHDVLSHVGEIRGVDELPLTIGKPAHA